MNAVLAAQGWWWATVGGSQVAHLCPPQIVARSRTACGRLALRDTTLVSTAALDGRLCKACSAYGARGGRA